jgi:hypothetical protein
MPEASPDITKLQGKAGGKAGARTRRAEIDAFLRTIAPDQYAPDTYVPWAEISATLESLAEPIARLQKIVDVQKVTRGELTRALREDSGVLKVLHYLFASPAGAGFVDGRELPKVMPNEVTRIRGIASLAFDLGLDRLMPKGANVGQLVQVAAVALDSRRRGFRRGRTLEARLDGLLRDAAADVSTRLGVALSRMPPSAQPPEARGRVGELLHADGVPVAALQPVIQATSGGRQQRDLSATYPRLQQDLDAIPVSLILIADGRGLQETPRRVLERLFDSVGACMSFQQAEDGMLADALESAVVNQGVRPMRTSSLSGLIAGQLTARGEVRAGDLPVSREAAVQALIRYAEEHADLALRIDLSSGVLNWENHDAVKAAQKVIAAFDPNDAAQLLAEALRLQDVSTRLLERGDHELALLRGETPPDRVLPETLVLAASRESITEDLVRDVARRARTESATARIAALISPDASRWRSSVASTSLQVELATSVVVIDATVLPSIVGARSPRDAFVKVLLAQADLMKANPFNYTGVTPRVMFFGRSGELARVRSSVRSNSIAILGGRRIGKTSLLQQTVAALRSDAWAPYYADLQAAGNWETFVPIIARWGVDVDPAFHPAHIQSVIRQLSDREGGMPILILDEVDNLLRWDLEHDDGNVSEALFRAFRAASQEGSARFIFSGERLIAERLWDPSSPHWNFCRPIALRQLEADASADLLRRPLSELGVDLDDEGEFLDVAWQHTQGHPQIVQYLGDLLVQELNNRPPDERSELAAADVERVVDSAAFKREYVLTYWGQATGAEKLITALLAQGATTLAGLRTATEGLLDGVELEDALRMLELYGIIDGADDPVVLRATWMPQAFEAFGGVQAVADDELARLRG